MRDIIVTLIIVGLMPTCFRRPFVGLIVFSWLAYMRVQDLTWGFARDVRWSFYVGAITFAGYLSGPRRKLFLNDLRSWVMILLVAIIGIGIVFSVNPDDDQFKRYLELIKIIGVALFTTAVVRNREHLRVLVWVIALSLGFYGVKSGIWFIATGARGQILQGPGGMLADNNDLSMALAMAVPMLLHIGLSEKREILRRAFLLCVPLTIITIGATYSRGGFLSVMAAMAVLVWRSRNRFAGFSIGALVLLAGFIGMPQDYKDRLATLGNPYEEGSAAGRLRAWKIATAMAMDNPLLGVGFGKYRQHYLDYCPDPTPKELSGRALIVAHNSYLQIWAECGTPAFALFLTLIGMSIWTCWKMRRLARQRYFASWIINYATMFEASIAAFVVGATFLNRSHFDLFYHWVAIILVFGVIAQRELEDTAAYPIRPGARGTLARVRPMGFGGALPQLAQSRGFRNAPLRPQPREG